ncbi:MAG TPA: isoleucine--tRNA ligase [Pirellulaceae bacterium]|nr:isoleucine--tRNA ligase [Pirellulaceae bacterium]HMO92139.1 isoleucine--tRNA ligase [Pirellulaceae bacterium]HMP68936.1 isoleucine--tRNA ligase [Pirellulaceae bacterium]
MFEPVDNQVSFPKLEEIILEFWKRRQIYDRSLKLRENCEKFVFFEGPPTANGLPHPGHCLTRAMKDLFPRYRTMRGYLCERKAGWDTHGLPVEVEVCKELGIHSKEEIENYGVEPFIHKCQQSVWRYMQEWERLTERLGFWIKLDEAYVTYHERYVESVWWSLKVLFDRGHLYRGHKIVWWWAQGGTALSSGEVGQGYRTVADPSAYVLLPLVDDPDTNLLIWTTTPWTLPSNQFAAVNPDIDYVTVVDEELGCKLVIAKDLVESIAEKTKRQLRVEAEYRGRDLIGKRYMPPFDYYYPTRKDEQGELTEGGKQHVMWRVVPADFVTTDSGTGLVHQAPAFGEVDYEVLVREQQRFVSGSGPDLICAVGPNGKFTEEAEDLADMWVKDADKLITRKLKESHRLYFLDQYLHEYPFCWRAENDPLIQYPRQSWFIRTTEFKQRMLDNNQQINWLPEHIKHGRFGNFLESNVDWALSRERYWGTPLPIWVCEKTGQMEAIDSYAALQQKPGARGFEAWEQAKRINPELPDDLRVHKPYIDEITYDSPFASGASMRRAPEVIDCWYDSGAMPFAQWGFPHQNADRFFQQFPADFISEALDQTRGWFYSLLAISTLVFDEQTDAIPEIPFPHPFRNCIVLGLMLSEWYESKKNPSDIRLTKQEADEAFGVGNYSQSVGKMSKQKRNYLAPSELFNRYGADALRWYFFANQPPWTPIRYSEQQIKDSIPEFLLRLWNVYGFFLIYANIDEFDPSLELRELDENSQLRSHELAKAESYRPIAERSEIDRWILAELDETINLVTERMDAYDNFNACARINGFVDALSNWYVRRSRSRFWGSEKRSRDKLDAYWTLYECLIQTSKLIAPFVPFVAESIWKNLTGVFGERTVESVHLCDFPESGHREDANLAHNMNLLREIASLGRAARMEAKLKVRQPLNAVTVILGPQADQQWLRAHDSILREELNVKSLNCTPDVGAYVTYQIQPNFGRLGQRLRALLPKVKQILGNADGAKLLDELNRVNRVTLQVEGQSIELDSEDIQVRLVANPGWAAAQGDGVVVVLATELTPELIIEGLARDIIRLVQDRRKELKLDFSDRIKLELSTDSAELKQAIADFKDLIMDETLTVKLEILNQPRASMPTNSLNQFKLSIGIEIDNG